MTHVEGLLLTKPQLKTWLQISDWQIRKLLEDPVFVDRCTANAIRHGSQRRQLRFASRAVAEYLGIPECATPQAPTAPAEVAA